MTLLFSPYAVPLFLAAAASAAIAWYALRRRQQAEALTFGLIMVALTWWSLCYALHICATDLHIQHHLNQLKYIGIMAVPPLWLILALQYAEQSVLSRRNLVLIFLLPVLLLLIVLTDHWTHLWWPQIWQEEFNGHAVMRSTHGVPYYLWVTLSYVYVGLGLWLYVRLYRRSEQIYRSQAELLMIAAAIPLVANVLSQIGLSPLPWGLDGFFFTVASVLIGIAIFRFRFLDIIPVARRVVVEQIPQGVIVVDGASRIVDVNPAARSFIGTEMEQIVGQPLLTTIEIAQLRQALLEMTLPGTEQPQNRDVYLDNQNSPRAVSVSIVPLSHGAENPIGQIILLQDISERVAAQQKLEALYQQAEVERERLALTIGTASDAIALLDADGRILASNLPARRILQAEQSDQFPPALQTILSQAQAADRVTKAEIAIGEQSFHVAAAPVAGTGLVLTMHDVSHLRQLARLKDDFVSTVSHDLRTPLTSIRGYAQLALRATAPETKRQDALRRIELAARRMASLITDLLDLATLEAGVETETEPVRLDRLARTAIETLEGATLAKGLTIHSELAEHPPLQADSRLLTQVWRNLIDNAIKYTEKGTITVRVEMTDSLVLGQVSDTGVGIAPTDLPYVFDKFFRAKHPFARGTRGTGLGLSLVKTIVERFGGQIWVDSEVGVGSTFTFTFALPPDQEQVDAQA